MTKSYYYMLFSKNDYTWMKVDDDFCMGIMIAEVSVTFRLQVLPASGHCKEQLKE